MNLKALDRDSNKVISLREIGINGCESVGEAIAEVIDSRRYEIIDVDNSESINKEMLEALIYVLDERKRGVDNHLTDMLIEGIIKKALVKHGGDKQ